MRVNGLTTAPCHRTPLVVGERRKEGEGEGERDMGTYIMLYRVWEGGANLLILYAKFWLQEFSQRAQIYVFIEGGNRSELLCYIGQT